MSARVSPGGSESPSALDRRYLMPPTSPSGSCNRPYPNKTTPEGMNPYTSSRELGGSSERPHRTRHTSVFCAQVSNRRTLELTTRLAHSHRRLVAHPSVYCKIRKSLDVPDRLLICLESILDLKLAASHKAYLRESTGGRAV